MPFANFLGELLVVVDLELGLGECDRAGKRELRRLGILHGKGATYACPAAMKNVRRPLWYVHSQPWVQSWSGHQKCAKFHGRDRCLNHGKKSERCDRLLKNQLSEHSGSAAILWVFDWYKRSQCEARKGGGLENADGGCSLDYRGAHLERHRCCPAQTVQAKPSEITTLKPDNTTSRR